MLRKSLSCNHKKIYLKTFFWPKSKPVSVGVLYWPPGKPEFIEYLDNSLQDINISNIQQCYLIGDDNVNLLSGNQMLLEKQHYHSYSQAPPYS